MAACRDIGYVLDKLAWMRAEGIWPNGRRYLWTDAFGVVLLVSLHAELKRSAIPRAGARPRRDVERVLGRPRGLRIGEAPDRDGQYFHYLAMWMYALAVLGRYVPEYKARGDRSWRGSARCVRGPGTWRLVEDARGPERPLSRLPGFGALDAFDGYVSYRLLDDAALAPQIARPAPARRAVLRRIS